MLNFLKKKKVDELEKIIVRLVSNISNNYKDNAQENFKMLKTKYRELLESGNLNEKQTAYYKEIIAEFEEQMKEFTHKDQKPYWT